MLLSVFWMCDWCDFNARAECTRWIGGLAPRSMDCARNNDRPLRNPPLAEGNKLSSLALALAPAGRVRKLRPAAELMSFTLICPWLWLGLWVDMVWNVFVRLRGAPVLLVPALDRDGNFNPLDAIRASNACRGMIEPAPPPPPPPAPYDAVLCNPIDDVRWIPIGAWFIILSSSSIATAAAEVVTIVFILPNLKWVGFLPIGLMASMGFNRSPAASYSSARCFSSAFALADSIAALRWGRRI